MLEKGEMLKDNNGVGTVKKSPPITPSPKSCLQAGVKKKISARFTRHFYPSPKYHPPLEVFQDPHLAKYQKEESAS